MAARNKPAGIRGLVYGVGKTKVGIEGLCVSGAWIGLNQAEHEGFFGRFLAVADSQSLVDPYGLVAHPGDRKAHFSGELVVGLALDQAGQDQDLALTQLTRPSNSDFNTPTL